MRAKLMHLLLLLALSVNIAHDAIIAVGDQHDNESIADYVLEQTQNSECGNLGESHHLFHFAAIIAPLVLHFTQPHDISIISYLQTIHPFSLLKNQIKPPIV